VKEVLAAQGLVKSFGQGPTLVRAVREGVSGLRPAHYPYRMPAFGSAAETLVQALAEGDGELPAGEDSPAPTSKDPTLGPLVGPQLAGFQGYACVSCHLWQGQQLSQPDPGASGPELTKQLVQQRPELKVIYMSGYTEDAIVNHGVLNSGISFLHKPFTSDTLGRKVREVLDR